MKKTLNVRKPITITAEAHRAAVELAKYLQIEKGLSRITITDATSLAILEALARREKPVSAKQPA